MSKTWFLFWRNVHIPGAWQKMEKGFQFNFSPCPSRLTWPRAGLGFVHLSGLWNPHCYFQLLFPSSVNNAGIIDPSQWHWRWNKQENNNQIVQINKLSWRINSQIVWDCIWGKIVAMTQNATKADGWLLSLQHRLLLVLKKGRRVSRKTVTSCVSCKGMMLCPCPQLKSPDDMHWLVSCQLKSSKNHQRGENLN